MNNRYINTDSI